MRPASRSPSSRGEGWVFGWSVLSDTNHITRRLGPPTAALPLPGVRNETHEAALFGQYSISMTPRLVATLGGRLTVAESIGEPLDAPDDDEDEPTQTHVHASPAAALTWRPGNGLLAYLRYQEGFRAGGLAVSPTDSASATQRLESDEPHLDRGGAALRTPRHRPALVHGGRFLCRMGGHPGRPHRHARPSLHRQSRRRANLRRGDRGILAGDIIAQRRHCRLSQRQRAVEPQSPVRGFGRARASEHRQVRRAHRRPFPDRSVAFPVARPRRLRFAMSASPNSGPVHRPTSTRATSSKAKSEPGSTSGGSAFRSTSTMSVTSGAIASRSAIRSTLPRAPRSRRSGRGRSGSDFDAEF